MNGLSLQKDLVLHFGNLDDGVIGIPALTGDGEVIEASYFFGKNKPKNIIVISSQAGCPMRCEFCELGSERFARNLTAAEIRDQALLVLEEAHAHGFNIKSTPHKVTIANTGEPLLNPNLVEGLRLIAPLPVSFKVSTVFPDSRVANRLFAELADFAARRRHPVQMQISLISTSETARSKIAGARVADFKKIREAGELWLSKNPAGRKINMSIILTEDMPCDAKDIADIFPPELFHFRFREYVPTRHGESHRLLPIARPRLDDVKADFRAFGYEVGDWASPSPVEWKFGLAGNVIRRMYLDMIRR